VLFVQEAFCADFPPKNIVAKVVLVVLSAMKLCVCVCVCVQYIVAKTLCYMLLLWPLSVCVLFGCVWVQYIVAKALCYKSLAVQCVCAVWVCLGAIYCGQSLVLSALAGQYIVAKDSLAC
jgi:hypothetical protein